MAIDLLTRAKDCHKTLDERKHNLFEVVRDAKLLLEESGATTFLINLKGEKIREIASHELGDFTCQQFAHEVDPSALKVLMHLRIDEEEGGKIYCLAKCDITFQGTYEKERTVCTVSIENYLNQNFSYNDQFIPLEGSEKIAEALIEYFNEKMAHHICEVHKVGKDSVSWRGHC